MTQKKNAQAKVEPWKYDELEKAARKQGLDVADVIRTLVDDFVGNRGAHIKEELMLDIASISDNWAETGTDLASLKSVFDEEWERVYSGEFDDLPERLSDRDVHVVGQGTSHSIALYLATRLRDRGLSAWAYKADELLAAIDDAEGVVIPVSRSGSTESLLGAVKALRESGLEVVAHAPTGSELDAVADLTIPVPEVEEATSAYTTRGMLSQVIVLQHVFLRDARSVDDVLASLDPIDTFVDAHVEHNLTASLGSFDLKSSSPFRKVSGLLKDRQDLRLNPIFASTGWYAGQGHEYAHKVTEYLHRFTDYDGLDHVRDQYINILYNGKGYLVALLPPRGTAEYDRSMNYLFSDDASIENVLTLNEDPQPFRLIALTMNGRDNRLEQACAAKSTYGEASLIDLQSPGGLAGDLVMFVGAFLFAYAILSEAWGSDPRLRRDVPRSIDDIRQ